MQNKTAQSYGALDRRLMAAADFVRPGAVVADIGTDHAYLPVFLIKNGRAERAIAADINQGPLDRARKNVRESGLEDKIELYLTNGLSGLENVGATDIAICGMGGELICKIIENAPFVFAKNIRLILQPMTKSEELYRYLLRSGFAVIGETLAKEDRVYRIICAEYCGEKAEPSECEMIFGKALKDSPLFCEYAQGKIKALTKKRDGLLVAGHSTEHLDALLVSMNEYLK